jgi:hypothetical protein
MDTSELVAALERRIEEARRDRSRLLEAAAAVDREIDKVIDEQQLIERLVGRYQSSVPANGAASVVQHAVALREEPSHAGVPDRLSVIAEPALEPATESVAANVVGVVNSPATKGAVPFQILWPEGSTGTKKIKSKKPKSRAKFKSAAARWYLEVLRGIEAREGYLARTVEVEMAVDGVVQSICGAVDAAVYALTVGVERILDIPEDRFTPASRANWSKLSAVARFFEVELASALSLSIALAGEHADRPEGWLAQLRLLVQRSAGEDVLVPGMGDQRSLELDVPGAGVQPTVAFLSRVYDQSEELLETIFHDLDDLRSGRIVAASAEDLRAQRGGGIEDHLAGEGSVQD